MKLQLIRNATLRIDYAGRTLLVDPFLAAKHSLPSYTGQSKNPLVDLPIPAAEIIAGVDLLLVSHLHSDHFDSVAKQMLPKDLPLLCQPGDETTIREAGFTRVTPLDRTMEVDGISVAATLGSHGLGEVLKLMGSVIGFVLRAPGEPTIYLCGDTVLYPPVLETIAREA